MRRWLTLFSVLLLLIVSIGCTAEDGSTATTATTAAGDPEKPFWGSVAWETPSEGRQVTIGGAILSRILMTTDQWVVMMVTRAFDSLRIQPCDREMDFLTVYSVSLGDRTLSIDKNGYVTLSDREGVYTVTGGDLSYEWVDEIYHHTANDSAMFLPDLPQEPTSRDGDLLHYEGLSAETVEQWLQTVARDNNVAVYRYVNGNGALIRYGSQQVVTIGCSPDEPDKYTLHIQNYSGRWHKLIETQARRAITAHTGLTTLFALPVTIDMGGGLAYTSTDGTSGTVQLPGLYEDTGYECVAACHQTEYTTACSYYLVKGDHVIPLPAVTTPRFTITDGRMLLFHQTIGFTSGVYTFGIAVYECKNGVFQSLETWNYNPNTTFTNFRFYDRIDGTVRLSVIGYEGHRGVFSAAYRQYTLTLEDSELVLRGDDGSALHPCLP